MDSYIQCIESAVHRHKLNQDNSQWPSSFIHEHVQNLQDKIKLPTWVKTGPYPHVDSAVLPLLGELAMSTLDGQCLDRKPEEDSTQSELWSIFGTVLSNCNAIRTVFESETLDGRQYSKESFLVILIRNVLMGTRKEFLSLENVSVALPLHFSGATSPLMKYMPRSFCAPLVIMVSEATTAADSGDDTDTRSDGQEGASCSSPGLSDGEDVNEGSHSKPVNVGGGDERGKDDDHNGGNEDDHSGASDDEDVEDDNEESEQSNSDEEDSSSESHDSDGRNSMSIFLEKCMQPYLSDEDDDNDSDSEEARNVVLPPEFDQHFLTYPKSSTAPSTYDIAVFCMAEHAELGLLMTSLLYQRRVCHIDEPLFGIGFSKSSSVVNLYMGWLDDEIVPHCILPRVHIGEIETNVVLDLSSPLMALTLAQLLLNLKLNTSFVQVSVASVACMRKSDHIELYPYHRLSWRIDTQTLPEDTVSNHNDLTATWIASQKDIMSEMAPKNAKQKTISKESTPPDHSGGGEGRMPSEVVTQRTSEEVPSNRQANTQRRERADTITPNNVKKSTTSSSESNESHDAEENEAELSEPEYGDVQEESVADPSTQFVSTQIACSKFAEDSARKKNNNLQIFCWLFDRQVIPRSFATDDGFFQQYNDFVELIWPQEWKTAENLPKVPQVLSGRVSELLRSVDILRRNGQLKEVQYTDEDAKIFSTIVDNFSVILSSSYNARFKKIKRTAGEHVTEADWRHDIDSLLTHFFDAKVNFDDGTTETLLTRLSLESTLALPKRDAIRDLKGILFKVDDVSGLPPGSWIQKQGGSVETLKREYGHKRGVVDSAQTWSKLGQDRKEKTPVTGDCDALGHLRIRLPAHISREQLTSFSLVRFGQQKGGKTIQSTSPASLTKAQLSQLDTSRLENLPSKPLYDLLSAALPTALPDLQMQTPRNIPNAHFLDLPILVTEYKKAAETPSKGSNQLRMYIVACVKFLAALGITEFPVFGLQSDGPNLCFIAAIQRTHDQLGARNNKIVVVDLFERLAPVLDISTAIGAWQCATILARLSHWHGKSLREKFSKVDLFSGMKPLDLPKWAEERKRKPKVDKGGLVEGQQS